MKRRVILILTFLLFATVTLSACNDKSQADSESVSQAEEKEDIASMSAAELDDGAIYRIKILSEEEKYEKGSLTADKFALEDNSFVKVEIWGKHLSQMWRAHKNDDGTYSFENMATGMYLSTRNPDNFKKEKKISVCLDGTNDTAKKWNIYSSDGTLDSCIIENDLSSCVVEGSYVKVSDIVYAQQEQFDGKITQKWSFNKVSDGNGEYPRILVLKGDYVGSSSCPEILYYNGVYYNYNMTGPITLKTSTDLINWKLEGSALGTKPSWLSSVSGGDAIWAPGAYKIGDKYYLYYCTSSSGSQNSAIGVAVTTDPSKNDWQDLGMVIRSYDKQSQYNCIDPNVFIDDDGTPYLVWGSYWEGIFMRKIDANTGKLDESDTTMYHLAKGNSDMEAPYLIKHGDYYYLFTARGGLKKGTYYWAVGRSKTLTGPYVDDKGKSLLEGGGTRLTEWKDSIKGVAHAQYFEDANGQAYMVSESWTERQSEYVPNSKNSSVHLHISTIVWTDEGWPVTALDKDVLSALGSKS